jgi:hypothetical protein
MPEYSSTTPNLSSKVQESGASSVDVKDPNIPESLELTPTVIGALKRITPDKPVSATAFAEAILDGSDHRTRYAGGLFASLELKETEERKPAQEWLDEIQKLFDPQRMLEHNHGTELHGRLVILGLGLLDRQLYEQLEQGHAFNGLVEDLQPRLGSLTDLLSDHGREIYTRLKSESRIYDSVPNWTDDPLQKPEDDLLGREAFARFLARRIIAIPPRSGAYAMHVYGPWGAGKSTLLNFLRTELTKKNLHLFDIDAKFEEELNAGKLSKELREVFERGGEPLDVVADLQDLPTEGAWKIGNISVSYLLRKKPQEQSGKIGVYTGQPKWLVVEFNAWRNQHVDPPWWSLLDTVFRNTKGALSRYDLLQEYWWRLSSGRVLYIFSAVVLMWVVVLAFGWVRQNITPSLGSGTLISQVATTADDVGKIIAFVGTIWGGILAINRSLLLGSAKAAATYNQRVQDPMNEIKERFNTLIKRLGLRRVAIFIDDLDRCQSSYVIELLEGIQTLFREAPVVYVVAADRRWLNACYENEYDKFAAQINEPGTSLGTLFLEKAFRFSTPMPGIPEELREQYWRYLLQLKSEEKDLDWENARKKAQETVSQASQEEDLNEMVATSNDRSFVEQQALREEAAVRLAAPEIIERLEHTLKPYSELLEPNPRAMKRLVNAYSANRALATLSRINVERHQLALWTILWGRWPRLASFLEQDPKMVANIGQENPPDVEEELKALFDDEDVVHVVQGGSLNGNLQAVTIEMCARMHA